MVLHFRVGHPTASSAGGPGDGEARGFSPSRSVAQLRRILGTGLSASHQRSLASLAQESDPELFGEGLLQLARGLGRADLLPEAAALYRWLDSENSFAAPGLRSRARRELDAVEGRGEVGARVEFLLNRFVREASEPTTLFAMGGAGALFRMTRLAALGRLAMTPTANFLTRGFGARATASMLGFAVEATAFPFLGRLGGTMLGRTQPWTLPDLGHEVAGSFLVLGALKLCGWASGSLYRRGSGLARGLPAPLSQQVFQQAGMLGGILIGHGIEESVGLRPHQDGATTLTDSLALLLQFNVAGGLTRRLFGRGFHEWERRLDMQAEALGRNGSRTRPSVFGTPALAMAGIVPSAEAGRRVEFRSTQVMMMEGKFGYEGEGAARPRKPEVRMEYPPEMEEGLSHLQEQMRSPGYMEGTREALRRRRPDEDFIDRLWFHQLRDLVGRVGFAKYVEMDDSVLLRRMEGYETDPQAELVHRVRRRLGERARAGSPALRLVEIRLNREKLLTEGTLDFSTPAGSLTQLGALAELQKALGERLHLIDPPDSAGDRILRVPSLSYAEALLQEAAGSDALQFHYVDGAIPRDQVMSLRSRRVVPVGLARSMVWFGDTQTWTYPFPFAMHDGIFHGSMDSQAVRGSYELSGRIYDWLRRRDSGGDRAEGFMDRLADGELGYRSGLLRGTLGQNLRIYFEDQWPRLLADRSATGETERRELGELLRTLQTKWEEDLSIEASEPSLAEAEHWRSLQSRVLAVLPAEELRISASEVVSPAGLRIEYPFEVEAAWRHLEERFADPRYYSGDRRQLARARPDPEAADAIWLHQAAHFIDVSSKMRYEAMDAEALLDLNPSARFPQATDLLRRAYSLLGERGRPGSRARRVLVIRPEDRSETAAQFAWERHVQVLPPLEETSRFLRHQLRFLDSMSFDGPMYFPSLSLLEALYRAAQGPQVQFHEVPGEIPRDLVMALRGRGVSPVGLSRGLIPLAHFGEEVHPFSFSSHDAFYHAGVLAQIPARHARTASWLYGRAQARLPEGVVRESFLDLLADLNVPSAQGLGLGMFRQMMEATLEDQVSFLQKAESPAEFQARAEGLERNLEAYRGLIESDFSARHDLARSRRGFLQVVETAQRRTDTARSVRMRTDALNIPAAPIEYNNGSLDLIREVESYYQDPRYYEGSREELRRRRVPLQLADRLWFLQAVDFANRIPNSEFRFVGPEALLDPVDPSSAEAFDRSLIRSAIDRLPARTHPEARQVLEISIPKEYIGPLDQKPEIRFLAITPLLHDFEAALDHRVQLWAPQENERVLFRLPSLSLTESLIQAAHGEDRGQLHFVPGVIPRDLVSALHARRVSPVGLTAAPLYFGEFEAFNGDGAIHPFSFSQHDVLEHAARDSALPRGIPEVAHWIYTRIREQVPDSRLREETLGNLTDLVFSDHDFAEPYRGLSHRLFAPLLSAYRRVQSSSMRSEQGQQGEEIRILGSALGELLRERFPEHPELARHLPVFEEEFEPIRPALENWNSADPPHASYLSSIAYPPEVQVTWDRIVERFGSKDYLSSDPEALRRNRMPGDWVDRLWTFQAQDYANRLPGAQVRVGDLNLFFQGSEPRGLQPDLRLLERAVAALGEAGRPGSLARQVVEVTIPAKHFEEGLMGDDRTGQRDMIVLATLFSAEDYLNHAILLIEPGEDSYRFRIPSLSFMEKVLQARHGAENANFHYVPGEIGRDDVMALRARRFSPVGLARNRIFLRDISELTHPFNFTAHDVFFHAMRDAGLPPEQPPLAERFYGYLRPRASREFLADHTMDRLAELDWPNNPAGMLDGLSQDLIRVLDHHYDMARQRNGEERRRELGEIHSLATELREHIRTRLVATAGLETGSLRDLQRLEAIARESGEEIRAAGGKEEIE